MAKGAPSPRVVSSAGREMLSCAVPWCQCPVHLPWDSSLRGLGFPRSPHPPCPTYSSRAMLGLGCVRTPGEGRAASALQQKTPGEGLEQVGRGNLLGKEVAWGWCRCPRWDAKQLHSLQPPRKDSTHPLKNESTEGGSATC